MIEYESNFIKIDGNRISLPYSIIDAEQCDERIYVIYDYMEYPNNAPANNLVCINEHGVELWVAKNPTTLNTDAYTNFCHTTKSKQGYIAVNNFAGYICQINKLNGDLGNVLFTK